MVSLLVAVFRVLVLLVSVQTTSVLHVVADVASLVGGGAVHVDDDCQDDGAGDACPPGCPSCHGAHGRMAAIPLSTALGPLLSAGEDEELVALPPALAPPPGAASPIFHPPERA